MKSGAGVFSRNTLRAGVLLAVELVSWAFEAPMTKAAAPTPNNENTNSTINVVGIRRFSIGCECTTAQRVKNTKYRMRDINPSLVRVDTAHPAKTILLI